MAGVEGKLALKLGTRYQLPLNSRCKEYGEPLQHGTSWVSAQTTLTFSETDAMILSVIASSPAVISSQEPLPVVNLQPQSGDVD